MQENETASMGGGAREKTQGLEFWQCVLKNQSSDPQNLCNCHVDWASISEKSELERP